MVKTPISTVDRQMLIDGIKKEKDDFPIRTLGMVAILILFIFIPGKGRRPSTYQEYGFIKPACIITLLIVGYSYRDYKKSLKALQSDLDSEEKVVKDIVIWQKRQIWGEQYRIFTNSDHKAFSTFDIEKEAYHEIKKDHVITIEYGEKSKILYKMDLNLQKIDPSV